MPSTWSCVVREHVCMRVYVCVCVRVYVRVLGGGGGGGANWLKILKVL